MPEEPGGKRVWCQHLHSCKELVAFWKKVGCWSRGDGCLALKNFRFYLRETSKSQHSGAQLQLLGRTPITVTKDVTSRPHTHLQPAEACCTIVTTCLRNKHLPNTDGETEAQSNSGLLTESVEGGNYEISLPCSCLLDAVHTKQPTHVGSRLCAKGFENQTPFTGHSRTSGNYSFSPKSFELQFTAHFLLLLNQKSQENSKTHKLKTKLSY